MTVAVCHIHSLTHTLALWYSFIFYFKVHMRTHTFEDILRGDDFQSPVIKLMYDLFVRADD